MSYSYLFKIIIIGDQSVGKSCLLMQFIDKEFKVDSDPTIGVEFGSKTIKVDPKVIKLQIWDTAGQQAYKSITRSYYRSTVGAILVYDITSRSSFQNISKWIEETHRHATNQNIVILLVGNKIDLNKQQFSLCSRQIPQSQGKQFADKHGLLFMECSAKTGLNVDAVFQTLSRTVLEAIDNGRIDPCVQSGGVKIGQMQPQKMSEERGGCC